jgi:uncharacterized protein (TIGR02996 family)
MDARHVDVPAGAVYLERVGVGKPMFWQITLSARTCEITSGAIGKPGKTTTKTFKSEHDARRQHNALIDAKLATGYAYALTGKPPDPPAVAAHDARLAAQLAADPSALAVYADWLQEHGDVRGELAALQLRLATHPDKKLATAIDKLLRTYRGYFYGPLAPYVKKPATPQEDVPVTATWRGGWIDRLELSVVENWQPESLRVGDVVPLIQHVPQVASAQFLRELVIAQPCPRSAPEFRAVVTALADVLPKLPTVRRLAVAECWDQVRYHNMGALQKLWKAARNLEYVKLCANTMILGKIALPACRELHVEMRGLSKENVKSITSATWPALETLRIWSGDWDEGATFKDLAPILEAKGFAKVKHLGLKIAARFSDKIAAAIPSSKILRQLETLAMSGVDTELLERHLLPNKAAFAKLTHLDLSYCWLDEKGKKLAKTLAKSVDTSNQYKLPSNDPEEHYEDAGE